jgi:Tfp pilus assembly protein PilN
VDERVKRFDFLKDGRPDIVDRVCSVRLPDDTRTPLSALLTSVLVVCAWWGLEQSWYASALREEASAQRRLSESQADVAAAKLERTNVDEMLGLDRRLREIRMSGSTLAVRLSDIANHVPPHAWLTSITNLPAGTEISGEADGFKALGETVTDLMRSGAAASPTLIRASKDDRAKNLLAFTVQIEEKKDASR